MKSQALHNAKRTIALGLALLTVSNGCVVSKALVPSPGMPEYEERNFVPVPGGSVNAAGGNLLLEREDMSLDTPLGTQRVTSTYNSANGRWFWNFETRYGGDVFIDERARVHLLFHMPIGTGIEGTPWI